MMKGHNDFLAEYYCASHDELIEFVVRRTGNHTLAEDIVHDAFLRMLTTDRTITINKLPALTYTIIRNLLTDRYRHLSYRKNFSEYLQKSDNNHTDDTMNRCLCHEIEKRIESGIGKLPECCREPYRLHTLYGLKISEIQHLTGENYKRLEHCLGLARKEMRLYMKRFS